MIERVFADPMLVPYLSSESVVSSVLHDSI